jgi:hypothetical protein
MPCILYKIYFWKVFHMYYNLICTPMWTIFFYSCKKWVLQPAPPRSETLLCQRVKEGWCMGHPMPKVGAARKLGRLATLAGRLA